MSTWQPIDTAPKDGTAVIVPHFIDGNDVHGYAPWKSVAAVIAWNEDDGWKMCFMEDGTADSDGYRHQFFMDIPTPTHWMPLPAPPARPKQEYVT